MNTDINITIVPYAYETVVIHISISKKDYSNIYIYIYKINVHIDITVVSYAYKTTVIYISAIVISISIFKKACSDIPFDQKVVPSRGCFG